MMCVKKFSLISMIVLACTFCAWAGSDISGVGVNGSGVCGVVETVSIPEPATVAILGVGATFIMARASRKKR